MNELMLHYVLFRSPS